MTDPPRSPIQALVVLGCQVGPGVDLPGAVSRRVGHAARVATALDVPVVVASGGRRWRGIAEAEAMRVGLIARGVPAERIVPELESLTTAGNARHTARLLRELGVPRIGLVTCDWHMERALRCFRFVGVSAEPFPALSPPCPRSRRWTRHMKEQARWWLARAWLATRGSP